MKRVTLVCVALTLSTFAAALAQSPPPTRRDVVVDTLHGVQIPDPYRLLEDQNSPETRAWIDAQNAYTHTILDKLPGRDAIHKRYSELVRVESISVPQEYGGYYFFTKREPDQDQATIYRRRGLTGPDEPLIDPHAINNDNTTSVSIADISNDGSLLVYEIQQGGADEHEVRIRNTKSREDLPDRLPRAYYTGVSITADKRRLYYTRQTDDGPRVYVHDMGSSTPDAEIFGKGYTREQGIGVGVSEDGRWLQISVWYGSAGTKVEIYAQDLANGGPIRPIVTGIDAEFEGGIAGDSLYAVTNWNAPNGRLLKIDLKPPTNDRLRLQVQSSTLFSPQEIDIKDPGKVRWRELIHQRSNATLQGASLIGGKIVASYLQNVTSRLRIFDVNGKQIRDVPLPTLGSLAGVTGRWAGHELFYGFDSFTYPFTSFRYDVTTGEQTVFYRQKVPVDTERFQVEQVWYRSKDGTRIPMFVVHRKGLKRDGVRPTLITAYGGFNVSETPYFSATAAIFAEQGGVYAVPNLRGGGEFGEKWHKAGMLANKQNVFDDFTAAAEYLDRQRWTDPNHTAIAGGSNGGLLVGAAETQRPDLYRAVICSFPLLDMLRYQNFLVAKWWVPEYGSSDNPDQFKWLYAYSPYHHVKPGTKYPATLLITGDSDTRVAPLHARKMTALLQSATSSGPDRPIMLDYDTHAGHSGGEPTGKVIDDATDRMAFLDWQLAVNPTARLSAR